MVETNTNERFVNVKMIHICWSCQKERELSEQSTEENKEGIKCDCGGFLVTPSGRVQLKLIPKVRVFQLNDYDGVAAESLEQAIDFYFSEILDYEEDLIDSPRALPMDMMLFDDETRTTQISVNDLIEADWKGKPFYAFSTEC